ncbi:MAG: prepilin-type N-terminal cleavage/methylation domain-containing protein [Planctomycetota bacterium]
MFGSCARERSFTLMEMIVVLSIIAIVMGMGVAMYLRVARVDRLSAAARALEGGLRAARSQAILERRAVRFRYNCERRCFYAVREADQPNVNNVYGDDGVSNSLDPATYRTGSDLDFIRGNVIREPLVGGDGLCNTLSLTDDDTWYDGSTGAYPGSGGLLPGQIVVLPGGDNALDTSPGAGDEVASTSREAVFLDAPEYLEGSILVVRQDGATGSWEMLDWDVVFDASGRATVPADFAVSMRRIRLGTLEGDLGTIELTISATTGEIVFRNL